MESSDCGSPRLNAETLLMFVLGVNRAYLYAHPERELTAEEQARYGEVVGQRGSGVPAQYITGHQEFWGLDFVVSPAVLIPRPETELLVDLALDKIDQREAVHVLDLGTGSGAIALAIARHRPRSSVLGVDASAPALTLACSNAKRLGIGNVSFIESDWFDRIPREAFAVIVSNPPYVARDDVHLAQGDLRFEPRSALEGGVDGLAAIRRILAGAAGYLAPAGWLFIEHGYNQAESVQALFQDAGYGGVESRRDLAGIPRVTFGQR